MIWWPFRKRTVASAASQLARHGAAKRRDAAREKIVEKAKAEARRMNRPDLLERLSR